MLKRITYHEDLKSFWIEKVDDYYAAYQTLQNALRGIESPTIMFALGQNGLRAAYNAE